MTDRPYNVLFLCTGNSARSILAEALINQSGQGKFRGFSAGSHPRGEVNRIALQLLKKMNLPTQGLRRCTQARRSGLGRARSRHVWRRRLGGGKAAGGGLTSQQPVHQLGLALANRREQRLRVAHVEERGKAALQEPLQHAETGGARRQMRRAQR